MSAILSTPVFNLQNLADPLYQVEHDRRMGAIAARHADIVARLYPAQADFAKALIPALNSYLNPPLPVLTSLVVLKQQLENGQFGIMAPTAAARMPLSILTRQDGRLQRYLTPVIALARQSWLTFNMAMKNRPLLQDVCTQFGVEFVTSCCCSLIVTRAGMGEQILQSPLLRQQDFVRSAADRLAVPVHMVEQLEQIPGDNTDLTTHEIDSFQRIEQLLNEMAAVDSALNEQEILQAFDMLQAMSSRAPRH